MQLRRRSQEVFWIATPEHMLYKLYWEISQFKQACRDDERAGGRNASFNAFNCAVTALHCANRAWAFAGRDIKHLLGERFQFAIRGNRSDVTAFEDALERQNRDFHICRRLANGSGYLRPGDHGHEVEAVIEHSPTSRNENIASFVIHDGEMSSLAVDVFQRTLLFWDRLYRELGYINDRLISSRDASFERAAPDHDRSRQTADEAKLASPPAKDRPPPAAAPGVLRSA